MTLFSFHSLTLRRAMGIILVMILTDTSRAADKVEWRTDYDTARKEAVEKNKPLFIDFGTEECVHCKRLHTSTFKDPSIIQLLNERFVPLKVDGNREPRLTQALRIQAYPTIILAGNDGKIHAWIEGYMDAGRLSEYLLRASAQQAPDWMTRDYQQASKSIASGDYTTAVALLKKIITDGKDASIQAKARETMHDLENQATGRLTRAKQMQEKGQSLEVVDILTDLAKRYAGTEAAEEGLKMLNLLVEKPDLRNQQRRRRAQELLADAREDFKRTRYQSCLDRCEILSSAYQEFPEAKEAVQLGKEIKNNKERMAKVAEEILDRYVNTLVTLGDTYKSEGQKELALECYEKVKKLSPNTPAASTAQLRVNELQSKPTVQ
jgi:thioredoxin-related protein